MVTARSESKAEDLVQRRSRFKNLLEVVVTGDLSAVGAFDDLVKDVDVIIHCASVSFNPTVCVLAPAGVITLRWSSDSTPPRSYRDEIKNHISNLPIPSIYCIRIHHNINYSSLPQPLPNEPSSGPTHSKTIIKPAISGTLSILRAARKSPTLKRLVLTSSTAAVLDITKDVSPGPDGDSYTADDWNPITYEEGARSEDPLVAYRAGKKFAELEAWANVDPGSEHLRQLQL